MNLDRDTPAQGVERLLVVTAERSDPLVDGSVPRALRELRDGLGMDVVFVSEFRDGQRRFRHVDARPGTDAPARGAGDPLEASYCQRVVDGRLPPLMRDAWTEQPEGVRPTTPFRVGAHLSTPVVLSDGSVYGTLCTYSHSANPLLRDSDLALLRRHAELVARKVNFLRGLGRRDPGAEWELVPASDAGGRPRRDR